MKARIRNWETTDQILSSLWEKTNYAILQSALLEVPDLSSCSTSSHCSLNLRAFLAMMLQVRTQHHQTQMQHNLVVLRLERKDDASSGKPRVRQGYLKVRLGFVRSH